MNIEHMILTTILVNNCRDICTQEIQIELWERVKNILKLEDNRKEVSQ